MPVLSGIVVATSVARLLLSLHGLQPQNVCRTATGGAGFSARDSAGIQIVENVQGNAPGRVALTLSPQPIVAIGSNATDSSYLFNNIVAATRAATGSIIVAGTQPPTVRLYTAAGVFVRQIGRAGQGPGEYQDVTSMHRVARDTLLLNDIVSRRLTLLSTSGALLSTSPLQPRETVRATSRGPISIETSVRVAGRFANGNLLIFERSDTCYGRSAYCRPPETGVATDTLRFYQLARGGTRSAELASLLNNTLFRYNYPNRDLESTVTLPLSPRASVSTAADRFYLSRGDRNEIQERTAEGRIVRLIRECGDARRVTASDVQRVRDSVLAIIQTIALSRRQDAIARSDELHRNTPFPAYLPGYTRLLVDATGRVWARNFSFRDQSSVWHVFLPSGQLTSIVSVPPRVEPLEIGTDYLVAKHIDQNDVETIRVYSINVTGR